MFIDAQGVPINVWGDCTWIEVDSTKFQLNEVHFNWINGIDLLIFTTGKESVLDINQDFNIFNASQRPLWLLIKTYCKPIEQYLFFSHQFVSLTHTHTHIVYTFVPSLWVNFSQGSVVITGPVVRGTAVRWPTERSISVFTHLIQCGLFKLAGQGEIRLYLLGMDFLPCESSQSKRGGGQGKGVYKAQLPFRFSTHVPG